MAMGKYIPSSLQLIQLAVGVTILAIVFRMAKPYLPAQAAGLLPNM